MDQISNPYRPGAGTPPPALIGRDDLIDRFGVTLQRTLSGRPGKGFLPTGLRGVGKTVLLNRFISIASDEGVKTAFIESPESGDFASLLAIRLRRILLEMSTGALKAAVSKAAVSRALGALRSFTLQLPDGSSIALGVDPLVGYGDSGILAEDLTDVVVSVGEAAAQQGTGLLLGIDEIQYLKSEELGAVIAAIHRTTQRELPVLLVGAGLPQLPGLAGEAKSYAERLFEFPEIGSLPPEQARQALMLPALELGVEYEDPALEQLVEEAHGYPYFLQEWGYHVWDGSPRSPITVEDVNSVRAGVVATLDQNFFRVRLNRLTPKEKEYLQVMAELGPGPHRSGDIAARLGVKVESVAPRRSALIAKGMIYSPAHGDTAFTVPLFDDFLRRTSM
ncbi:MAG: AAA family ATPase [Acidimicrobiaceae bacterium]|nr:AAA family ATPase [Acidimicrobiaceae bacterium]